jgi:hypothetical protein
MNKITQAMIAASAVFCGSLLADIWFGDGIQSDDIQQALMVALIAGVIQMLLKGKHQGDAEEDTD